MSSEELFRRAHVAEVKRALVPLGAPAFKGGAIEHRHADALRPAGGGGLGPRPALSGELSERAGLTVFERQTGKHPSDRTVAERRNPMGHTDIQEGLCADDAAGAPGAVHKHGRRRRRRYVEYAQREFAARHALPARNAHGAVFLEAARIEDDGVGRAREQRVYLAGRKRRRLAYAFDKFAERFARHIHVLKHLADGAVSSEPAGENRDIAIAERRNASGRASRETLTIVIDHDRDAVARHEIKEP